MGRGIGTALFMMMASSALATDFGIHGHVFPIEEEDLLEAILTKLNSLEVNGDLKGHQEKIIQRSLKSLENPKSLRLPRTLQERIFTYDPRYSHPTTLKDHSGRVFYTKGTYINPLDTFKLSKTLIFVDGDDSDQMDWLKNTYLESQNQKPIKVILVGGPVFKWMKKLNRTLYFDQKGVLVEKLGIKAVPASVYQDGKLLKIQEHKIRGSKS